jgi:hypothetical protein
VQKLVIQILHFSNLLVNKIGVVKVVTMEISLVISQDAHRQNQHGVFASGQLHNG